MLIILFYIQSDGDFRFLYLYMNTNETVVFSFANKPHVSLFDKVMEKQNSELIKFQEMIVSRQTFEDEREKNLEERNR